jgi:general secretion pathway protein A
VLLTGEIGAGKTTVCRCFLEQIPKAATWPTSSTPSSPRWSCCKTVCEEFHVPVPADGGTPTVKTTSTR